MSAKRKLKKDINYVTYELLTECFTIKHLYAEIDNDKFKNVLSDLVNKRNELISRVNHPEVREGETLSGYYRKIRTELADLVVLVENLTN